VATAADKSASGNLSAGVSASTPATNSSTNGEENYSRDDEEIAMHESIGSDVAFAMVLGTGAREVYQWWIGRIAKLFKGKWL
jgi:hypothetical protein